MIIQELYLKKAVEIRKEYLRILKELNNYDQSAKDLSTSIQNRTDDLKNLLERINQGKVDNPVIAQGELHKIIIKIEQDMNAVDTTVDKLNESMDMLMIDEAKLLKDIKQKYFNLSDQEIRNEIEDHLKKITL